MEEGFTESRDNSQVQWSVYYLAHILGSDSKQILIRTHVKWNKDILRQLNNGKSILKKNILMLFKIWVKFIYSLIIGCTKLLIV